MKVRLACAALMLLTVAGCRGESGGLRLPVPPRQDDAWQPDPGIPTNLLSAAEAIYAEGFPDPRGCEYRQIEIAVSGVWEGKVALVKTRGWVLPEKSGTNQFAICWNGLIYPAARIFQPADLRAEIMSSNPPVSRRFGFGGEFAAGEVRSVIYAHAQSTRTLLLLRGGETAAAVTDWIANQDRMRSQGGFGFGGRGPAPIQDPYLEFARDWAWAMFDRTLCAHMRGDEALALATARQLAGVQPKIEAECARRGFPHQQYYDSERHGQNRPYLDFLDQLPRILADLERRQREDSHGSVMQSGLPNSANQTERIAALIRDLDLVSARQSSLPGWVNLAEDPIVSALIREGDPAVEPLLDCIDHDQRLTRSVGFGRDFFRLRTVIPVSEAAMTAVKAILQAGFSDGTAEIRAYWDKYKGLKLADRWYAILQDDAAGARWAEAAARIVQPENVALFPGGSSVTQPVPANAPVRMRGEILRTKSNPSVSELMTRRALEVPAQNPNAYDLATACQIGLDLAAWDPPAAGPVVQSVLKRCLTVLKYSAPQTSRPGPGLGTYIPKLALASARNGDTHGFADYAAWLPTMTPDQFGFSPLEILEPLRKFPTNEILRPAAASLFGDTNSSWSRLPWTRMGSDDPAASDLVGVPAFRLLLVRELSRKEVCGSISFISPNRLGFELTNYWRGSRTIPLPTDDQPANGASVELRWCDWVALSLASGKHIPPFNPFVPFEKRDAIIEQAKAWLTK